MILSSFSYASAQGHPDINVALLGDSNTWIGGEDCKSPKGWPKWFIDKFRPASCTNYSRSGATWTNTPNTQRNITAYTEVLDDNNVIYNQIERLIDSVDKKNQPTPELIIIGAGTNDAWFSKKRPGVFTKSLAQVFADYDITKSQPSDMLSLAESVRYGCELLMSRFPDSQIVLLTPAQATVCSYDNIRKVADIIRECGNHMSIGVVSLDQGGGIYSAKEKQVKNNTYDGAHTSEKGARRHGNYIANSINSMLQF